MKQVLAILALVLGACSHAEVVQPKANNAASPQLMFREEQLLCHDASTSSAVFISHAPLKDLDLVFQHKGEKPRKTKAICLEDSTGFSCQGDDGKILRVENANLENPPRPMRGMRDVTRTYSNVKYDLSSDYRCYIGKDLEKAMPSLTR